MSCFLNSRRARPSRDCVTCGVKRLKTNKVTKNWREKGLIVARKVISNAKDEVSQAPYAVTG